MTNSDLANMITIARHVSTMEQFGISWLMSNGDDIKVAYTEKEKEFEKKHGYFVAVIFENGNIVNA